jgi:hypothetical protein
MAKRKERGIDSDPAEDQAWEYHIQALKQHAGNMGLVSLILLFEAWLDRRGKKLEQLADSLPELREMRTARNSIVHHRGEAEFQYGGQTHVVNDRFLDFDGRVGIEEPLLTELAGKLKALVNLCNQEKASANQSESKS